MRFDGENIVDKIRDDLMKLSDEGYKEFHAKLIPEIDKDRIIGVRTPELRKYANQFAKHESDVATFKKALPHRYYDEMNLHGFLIEKNKDFDTCIKELDDFLEVKLLPSSAIASSSSNTGSISNSISAA